MLFRSGAPAKEGLRAASGGAGPAGRLDRADLRIHWAPVSLICLCVSRTHPLSLIPSHIPLSCCPSSFSRFPGPPSVSWFLLLPCPALALTLRITHSLLCAWLTLSAAQRTHTHTHTHTPTAWGHSFLHTLSHTLSVPVTTLTCTPAHPRTRRAAHARATSQLLLSC